MFIPERQREALMRLTMCARDECMMCIYQPKDDRCKDIATTAMHILANALKVDDDAPQTDDKDINVRSKDEPQKDCKKCKNYDRCKNNRWKCCVYEPKNEPQTDCGWGEPVTVSHSKDKED